jgi:integrase
MLWDSFLKFKETVVKKSTMETYRDTRTSFFELFLPDKSVETLTLDRLLEWKIYLLGELAEATVAGRIKKLKALLNWAVDREWLVTSPARKLTPGNSRNREYDRFVTMAEYAKLLDACPDQEWRTIIALARIGGLRCPSELRQLRWTDILQDRFTVHSPKTEHHAGRDKRVIPLFAELREELDRLDKTTEFVIQSFQGTTWNLHEPFRKIVERAGLGRIRCPFVNMRRSRANEVVRRWGEAKESQWIGHSWDVMEKHYLLQLDEDFSTC